MRRTLIFGSVAVIGLLVFWFLAVDWVMTVENCPECVYGRDVMQYRVFGFVIHERICEDPSLIEMVASDMGLKCQHPRMESWRKHRWWGLCICASPCINGMHRLGGDIDYSDAARDHVKKMVNEMPSLRAEFQQRVLVEHDWDYWRSLVEQIRTESEPKTNPLQLGPHSPDAKTRPD